jgi:hypothetical protein
LKNKNEINKKLQRNRWYIKTASAFYKAVIKHNSRLKGVLTNRSLLLSGGRSSTPLGINKTSDSNSKSPFFFLPKKSLSKEKLTEGPLLENSRKSPNEINYKVYILEQ